jgi:branched-chain amino acid transport system ATP-binding protein
VEELTVERAGVRVVRNVSLAVDQGSVSVVLGANGAGKTTLLQAISGVIPAAAGRITLLGRRVERQRPGRRARLGLAHVEQGRTVFGELTAEENLRVAARAEGWLDQAFDQFPELARRRGLRAGLLSGGEQQMLVLARALVGRPRVVLIDEMSLGLAPIVVRRLMDAVRRLAEGGTGVLLVEQFAALALTIGDRAYVLQRGAIVYEGDCERLRQSREILRGLYLGAPVARP